MTPDQIRTQLQELALDAIGRNDLPEGPLADALDSMDQLALVVAIEDHFKVIFEPEDEAQVVTIDDLIATLHRKLADG